MAPEDGLGIYVHWPFCISKCPYCDFNSHVAGTVDAARWRDALLMELAHAAQETRRRVVTSIFFGGGTPSLMSPQVVEAVIDGVQRHWPLDPDLEVTLEANPSSVDAARFASFAKAGVNRLSVGVQSIDDDVLRFLGRVHGADEARRAVDEAARHVRRYSFDLIYGWPGQTTADWRRSLSQALKLAGSHVSLYQLTIEPGTAFHRQRVATADDDTLADLYEVTQEVLEAAGLPAYEVSNHATAGDECRHNLAIWRGGDYVGIGPGAHGRLRQRGGATMAQQRHRAPERWLAAVEHHGHGSQRETRLKPIQRGEELLLLGLRLAEGIDPDRFRALTGLQLDQLLNKPALDMLSAEGLIEWHGGRLRVCAKGVLCLDAVLLALLNADPAGAKG
ncbi:MAG: coproporphyrinogen III oxidase [Rhodospirillales bacterium]|nr:MAG: coproporphyrinogen III oxidase [Rhodospirillales bacterium]